MTWRTPGACLTLSFANERSAPPGGWIGVRTEVGDDHGAVALLPQKVREALERAGYELDAVLQGWREMKALHEAGVGSGGGR